MKLAISALVALGCCAAQAQTFNYYVTEVRTMVNDQLHETYAENNPNLLEQSSSIEGVGFARSTGQLALGVNKVSAHYESNDPNSPANILMSDARTQWIDEVTIDGGELNGTTGYFTASLQVFGSADFSMSGAYTDGSFADVYGFWDSWIGTSTDGGGSYLVGGWFGSWYSDFDGSIWYEGDELNQPLTEVTLEFIYGQPFLLSGMMESYVDAENMDGLPATVSASLDFSHSAYWNGISGFYDGNHNRVNIGGLSSRSGTNWAAPVPEPTSIAFLAIGLAALARKRRNRA